MDSACVGRVPRAGGAVRGGPDGVGEEQVIRSTPALLRHTKHERRIGDIVYVGRSVTEELAKINGRYPVFARLQIGRQLQSELQERFCIIHFLWISALQRVTEKKVSHLEILFISIEGIRIIVVHVNVHPFGEFAAQPKEDAAEPHVGPINVNIHVNVLSRPGRHRVLAVAANHRKPNFAKVRMGRANAGVAAKVW